MADPFNLNAGLFGQSYAAPPAPTFSVGAGAVSLELIAGIWQSAAKQGAPALPHAPGDAGAQLDPLPPDPTAFNTQGHPEVPSAIITATTAAVVVLGPQKVWYAGKWIFRNVLVGASVVEAASWYVAFQTNLFKAGTLSHDLQNYLLGQPHNAPLFTEDYTFLQRQLSDIANLKEQRDLAQRFLNQPLAQTIADRDALLAQSGEIGAQEAALLAARIIDLRLEAQRLLLLEGKAQQLALQAASAYAQAAFFLFGATGATTGIKVPAGSADP